MTVLCNLDLWWLLLKTSDLKWKQKDNKYTDRPIGEDGGSKTNRSPHGEESSKSTTKDAECRIVKQKTVQNKGNKTVAAASNTEVLIGDGPNSSAPPGPSLWPAVGAIVDWKLLKQTPPSLINLNALSVSELYKFLRALLTCRTDDRLLPLFWSSRPSFSRPPRHPDTTRCSCSRRHCPTASQTSHASNEIAPSGSRLTFRTLTGTATFHSSVRGTCNCVEFMHLCLLWLPRRSWALFAFSDNLIP